MADKNQPPIYIGPNKPTASAGGQTFQVEKTMTGAYQPVEPPRQWTQEQRQRLVAALVEWANKRHG